MRQFFDRQAPASVRWRGALLVALGVTAALRLTDGSLAARGNREYGTLIARQLGSAAEGLVLAAQQKKIADPAHWAVSHLAQGVEPRLIRISNETVAAEDIDVSSTGIVDYKKPFTFAGNENSAGVRITVTLPRSGFLGTTTALRRDLATLGVAALLTCLFGVLLSLRATRWARESAEGRQRRINEVIPELRDVLLLIGRQLKDLFVRFEELGSASGDAHGNVARARESHHLSLRSVRKVIQSIDELNGHSMHVEASTLNVLAHSGRQDMRSALLSARLAHQQLVEMRQKQQKLQDLLHELELKLEPVATDLDLSFHALQQSAATLREVPGEIRRTGEHMHTQARIFQMIRQELRPASPAASASAASNDA